MVILDLRSLDLDDSIDLLAVTWEVSDDPSYKNILLESVEDYKNKTSIIFSENLDPDMKYYARARALTTAGWTSWGNVDIFKVRNNTDLTPQDIFPTKVSIPRIRTFRMVTDTGLGYMDPNDIYNGTNTVIPTNNKNLTNTNINADKPEFNTDAVVESLLHEIDPEAHDLTLFEIWVDGFEVIGNATLKATSYWIEDSNGDVIWKSLVDRTNRNKIKIQDLILKADRSYRIRVVFHTDSNDVSQIATKTIVTKGSNDINLISYLDQVPFNKDIELQLEWVKDMNHIKWEVLQYSLGIVKSVWKTETTSIITNIPKGVLNSNSNYLLRIKSNLSDSYKYYPFITTIAGDESPNDPLTPLLVYPTTVTLGLNSQAKILVESIAKNITYVANSEYYTFNPSSNFITGIKVGEGVLYVKAKIDNYRENIIEVKVNVVAEGTSGGTTTNNKFLKVKPDIIDLEVAEEQLSTITTNCDHVVAETTSDNIRVSIDGNLVRILGTKDGTYKILVIGYDIADNATASAMITGKITDTGVVVPPEPEEPEPEPTDYFLELEPASLEMRAGENKLVKINTNAPFWDPRISEGDFFTYKKMSSTDLKITSSGVGEGMIVIYASSADGDVAEAMLNIRSIYNSATTEMIFDEASYTCRILNEIEIPFTSNITSVDEYNVTVDNESIELIRKLDSSFILRPKYEAANQSFNVVIVAKKNTTLTHIYSETSVNITLIVPDITYAANEVIVFPNEPKETYNYLGGIWAEYTYYPPNPINFRIYTHSEAVEDNIDLITNPYIDGTGVVISKKLGEIINRPTDKFNGLRPLDFMIKTGNEDNVGNPENSNIYKVKPVVTVRGIPYERNLTLTPTERTNLNLSATEITMDIFSSNTTLRVNTNASDYTVRTSNSNVVIPTKTKDGTGANIVKLTSGIDGTAILTFEAMNDSGILVIDTCTIKVGNEASNGELARPLPGQPGFGVGTAPLELSTKYGLVPVDPANVNNPEHHTFGNYKDADDNIMCFIPKMYFYRDNSDETIAKLGSKLRGGYYDKDKWLMRMSYTQEGGYWLHRAFINNGKEIDGIFVDKYLTSFTGTTAQELSIPRSVPTGQVYHNLSNKQVTHNGVVKTLNKTADKPLWLLIPKNRNEHTALMDVFVDYLLGDLWRVERDSHIEKGTEDRFTFNNHVLKQPFPLIGKATNNTNYRGMIDSLSFDLPDTINLLTAAPVDIDNPDFAKFTHTGYSSGIVYPIGIWQTETGITQLYASLGDNRLTPENKSFWPCNAFKLSFDRSNLNIETYSDPDTYDKFGIVMNETLLSNKNYVFRVDGSGEGYSSLGNNTDINSSGYLLNSLNMPEYIEDYTLFENYKQSTIPELEQNDCRPYFPIRTFIETTNIFHIDIHSHADGNFSMYGYIDLENNPMLGENYSKKRARRMMIVPNEGTDLNVTNQTDYIYTTNKPTDRLDWSILKPGGDYIVGTNGFDGNYRVVMRRLDTNREVPYTLTTDLEHLKIMYPRYPIPSDSSKVEVVIEPLFTEDYGTLEFSNDALVFTPGSASDQLTSSNPARFNVSYRFKMSELDMDYKVSGVTVARFLL